MCGAAVTVLSASSLVAPISSLHSFILKTRAFEGKEVETMLWTASFFLVAVLITPGCSLAPYQGVYSCVWVVEWWFPHTVPASLVLLHISVRVRQASEWRCYVLSSYVVWSIFSPLLPWLRDGKTVLNLGMPKGMETYSFGYHCSVGVRCFGLD